MNRQLKFRVWNNATNDFLNDAPGTHCFSEYYLDLEGGGLVTFDGTISDKFESYTKGPKNDYYFKGTEIIKESPYVITQFTGLVDKNNKEIFEGDIIKFFYRAGDFAIMDMSEKEYEYEKSIQKEYIGVISPNPLTSINLEIVVGDPESTHMMFPLSFAARSEVIGNIFQNPELLS